MLNSHLLCTDQDRKEAAAIDRRRRAEAERQARVFNNKYRKIGVDVKALNSQVEYRKSAEESERQFSNAIAKQIQNDEKLASLLFEKELQERYLVGKDLNTYRKVYQRKEDTRDFDLIDPDFLKKQPPIRSSDSEDIGLPTGQKFEGEDLRKEERERVMKQQASSWLRQQMEERRNFERMMKMAEDTEKRASVDQDMRALQLELMERDCNKMMRSANDRYNKALADERMKMKIENMENEKQDNQAEIYNTLTSDLMTENPQAANSLYGPHRVIPYMYKGMSAEEIQKIKASQTHQIKENSLRRDGEKNEDYSWSDFERNLCDMVASCDLENDRKRRMAALQTQRTNLELAEQQKEQQQFIDKVLYANKVTEDFFGKFNTSSR